MLEKRLLKVYFFRGRGIQGFDKERVALLFANLEKNN